MRPEERRIALALAVGVALLLAYSAGLALPLLAAAFLTAKFFTVLARFKSAMRYVEITAGLILAAAGALLFFDKLIFWA